MLVGRLAMTPSYPLSISSGMLFLSLLFTRYMSGEGGLTTCNLYKIKDVFSNQHRNDTKDICYKKNLQQNTYQIPAGQLLPQNDYIMYSRSSLRRQFRSL